MNTIGEIAGYTIRLVDGEVLRQDDPDFDDYGTHGTSEVIPEKEIWIDGASKPEERIFLVLRAIYERFLHERGLPDEGIRRSGAVLDQILRTGEPVGKIKTGYLGKIGELDVWLIDADQVRKQFYPDFTLGGNGYRYDFVPKTEIWVSDSIKPLDRAFTLLHELYEVSLMQGGMEYDPAHEQATYIEKRLRNLVPVGLP